MSSDSVAFADALVASNPAPDRAEKMMLYGQFIGSWDGTVVVHRADGQRVESSCEVHFGWALAGRAVQDVWIAPSRSTRGAAEGDRMYGTTLRVYDLDTDRWEITWVDPVRRSFNRMVGRAEGDDIVQEYRDAVGAVCQWCFTEIQPDSFHWISRESTDEGTTWKVTGEFFLERRQRRDDAPRAAGDEVDVRAFDFWVGSWRVTDRRSGACLGTSRVARILAGRVLHEQWSGTDGQRGESFNVFDRDRRCWHQSWVSDNGTLLLLDGNVKDGVMDLQGTAPDGVRQRIRWTPEADGSVVQLWESSQDDGVTWTTRFEGVYRRA